MSTPLPLSKTDLRRQTLPSPATDSRPTGTSLEEQALLIGDSPIPAIEPPADPEKEPVDSDDSTGKEQTES